METRKFHHQMKPLAIPATGQKVAASMEAVAKPRRVVAPEKVINLFGGRAITPESYKKIFGQEVDSGQYAKFPPGLTINMLRSACPFEAGKKVFETHMLVYVPKMIGEAEFTIGWLVEHGPRAQSDEDKKRGVLFWKKNTYGGWHVKDRRPAECSESSWVLTPRKIYDGFTDLSYKEQEEKLTKFNYNLNQPDLYKTIHALPLVTALIMNDLQNKERLFADLEWLRCKDQTAGGLRVEVGDFFPQGLGAWGRKCIRGNLDKGLGLFRNLN